MARASADRGRKRRLNWARLVLLVTGLVVVTLCGAACGVTYASLRDLPPWRMDTFQPGAPSVLYDATGKPFAKLGFENYLPVDFREIPPVVKQAFLAAEDARFYQHHGIDLRAVVRAALTNLARGRVVQGGSTITQQVARNAFLSPSRTFKRKIQEAFLAVQLERHYTKDEIFAMYLNRIYFGEGAWGIGAAAKTYFNKDVGDLTLGEAALLAGLPQAPSFYSPYRNPQAALARRSTVLRLMVEQGFLAPEEAERAGREPLRLKNGMAREEKYAYPYFVDYVIQELGKKYGEAVLYRGGLRIYTTLDPRAQEAAERAVGTYANFPSTVRDRQGVLQPQAAIVVLDARTGGIRALVGGREHAANLAYNRATQAYRQPGSAFKPIIAYAPAIEYLGMTPDSVVNDTAVAFGDYRPQNYDRRYRGPVTLRDALAYSINVPAVRLLNQVGLERAVAMARRMGITTLDPRREGLSLALGGLHTGVTPLQMAAAYAVFAGGGVYVAPTAVTRITQADGTLLEECRPAVRRVMSSRTADAVTEMLRAAVDYGTGTRARITGLAVAGKTGTTDQGRDTWFCGYTERLVGVVWIGWDLPRPMPHTYGGTYCARIWREVMARALGVTVGPPAPPPQPAPEPPPPPVTVEILPETGTETEPPPATTPPAGEPSQAPSPPVAAPEAAPEETPPGTTVPGMPGNEGEPGSPPASAPGPPSGG
ncbi:MAG: penicillin-binding protein 1A [Bacillota bacterium]